MQLSLPFRAQYHHTPNTDTKHPGVLSWDRLVQPNYTCVACHRDKASLARLKWESGESPQPGLGLGLGLDHGLKSGSRGAEEQDRNTPTASSHFLGSL